MYDRQTNPCAACTRVCLLSCCIFCYSIAPPEPEAEKHAVENILEDIIVQYVKPVWMMLYCYGYQCDTQDVKKICAHKSKWNKPQFVLPTTAGNQHDDNPYKRLLQSCTAPYDLSACARGEMNGARFKESHRIIS